MLKKSVSQYIFLHEGVYLFFLAQYIEPTLDVIRVRYIDLYKVS